MSLRTVDTWLRRNEQFTNEFILDWVKDHPELHLALFKSNPYFDIPSSLTEIVHHTCSKDSGVDIQQGVSSQVSEEGLPVISSLKISTSSEETEQEVKLKNSEKVMEIRAEMLRTERLEEMLVMSTHLHAKTFVLQDVIMKVMQSAQQFLKCTLVHFLLNDCHSSKNDLQVSTAFVVASKSENYTLRNANEKFIPCLMELIKAVHQIGSTFEIDHNTKTISVCLRGGLGTTIGFLVLIYSDVEMTNLIELDLTYLELFSQICGTAIENSLIMTEAMTQLNRADVHIQNLEEINGLNNSEGSQNGSVSSYYSDCDGEREEALDRSASCPQLAT